MVIRGDRRNTGGCLKNGSPKRIKNAPICKLTIVVNLITCKQLPENLRVELKKLGLLKYQMARLNYWGKTK